MTCKDIENKLPVYLEDVLPPGEKKLIEEHLASCPQCSSAVANLKKAGELVRNLSEVEPPPWLKQRIMSRIREEAHQGEGIIKKLFYPLHIKIPLQAFATLLIAVLAFHVYQTGEMEMKRTAPYPAPVQELSEGPTTATSRKAEEAPPVKITEAPLPAGRISETDTRTPAPGGSDKRPRTEEKQIAEGSEPEAAKPDTPFPAAREKGLAPVKDEEGMHAVGITGQRKSDKAIPTPSREQKQDLRGAYSDSLGEESAAYKKAPAAPRFTAKTVGNAPPIAVVLYVKDIQNSVRDVESLLGTLDARIVAREPQEGKEILTIEIRGQAVKTFFEQLKKIGEIREENALLSIADGNLTVKVAIIGNR